MKSRNGLYWHLQRESQDEQTRKTMKSKRTGGQSDEFCPFLYTEVFNNFGENYISPTLDAFPMMEKLQTYQKHLYF